MPFHCHECASWLPFLCLLIATCGPVVGQNNCHTWATSVPVECHALASWLLFMYQLIATGGPVVCHIGASCLPHMGHIWARQRSHVGHTWVTVAKNVWPTCGPIGGSHFNCHMWALCGPLVECLLGNCRHWFPLTRTRNAVLAIPSEKPFANRTWYSRTPLIRPPS